MIVCSFHTGGRYAKLAKRLESSLDKLGIKHEIVKIRDRGSWQRNTLQKPDFILRVMKAHPREDAILWLDADAVVIRPLDLLVNPDFDIAAYRFRPANLFHSAEWHNLGILLSGTVYFRRSTFSQGVLEAWMDENRKHPERLDQKSLAAVLSKADPTKLSCLPPEYCWVERFMRPIVRNLSPVIIHEARAMGRGVGQVGSTLPYLSSPPPTWRRKTQEPAKGPPGPSVLWSGHLFDLSGYAKANREILFRVSNTLRASILPAPKAEPVTVNDYLKRRLDAMVDVSIHETAPLVRFYVPVEEEASPRHRVVFTMMETSHRVHRGMVDTINRNYSELWTPTAWNAKTFKASGVRVPIYVMPLGVDQALYRPGAPPAQLEARLVTTKRAGRHEAPKGFRFVTVCQPTFRKGLAYLVKAFGDAFGGDDSVSLIIATTAHEDLFARTNPFSLVGDPVSMKARVYHLTGRRTDAEMAGLFSACNAYVSSSLGEGFNLPLFEAAACGLPVIAPDHTSHSEFLGDSNAFLFSPDGVARYPEGDHVCDWYAGMKFASYGKRAIGQLSSLMREVSGSRRTVARIMAKKLSGLVRTRYTWDMAAQRVTDRLLKICGAW